MILTNIIEVLHQFAIDVFHGANAILHPRLGNISNPFDDGRRNVHPSFVGTSTGRDRQSACFLLPTPFGPQATNSAIVRTRCGHQAGPTRRPARTCRERQILVATGSPSCLSTSPWELLLDFWCRATRLSDCGYSVVPPGAAGLTRSADGAKVWPHPGTGQAVAPANSPS